MLAQSYIVLAIFPYLALADDWWGQYLFDPAFEFQTHNGRLTCEPSLTVIPGTTLIHQTIPGNAPLTAPTGFPEARLVGQSPIDKWSTAVTWEHQSPTTIPVPCPTSPADMGSKSPSLPVESWVVMKNQFSRGDVTIKAPYLASITVERRPTITVTSTATVTHTIDPLATPEIIEVYGNEAAIVCPKPITSTVYSLPFTTTVTSTVFPQPSARQLCTRCTESHAIQGWNYQVMFDNVADVYVNHPFPVVFTLSGVYAPRAKYQVKVNGADVGFTSDPRGGDVRACSSRDPGEKCIANGASWGQWTLSPGFNTISITNISPERGYFTYKISVCN